MKIGENGFTLKETLLLSAAVGFFVIWVGEVFQGIPLKASYFWVMFSIVCLMAFQYVKNNRIKAEEAAKDTRPVASPKSKKAKK